MNEENGQPEENSPEGKSSDTHPPVPVIDTAESYKEGPKGTEQGKETAALNHISRFMCLKDILAQISPLLRLKLIRVTIYLTDLQRRHTLILLTGVASRGNQA